MDIQELITRGRFVFSKAEERLRVFGLVNGRRNTADIAKETRRHANNVHRDLQILLNSGLIQPKIGKAGEPLKIDGLPVYEKVPLARTIPIAYFRGPSKPLSRTPRTAKTNSSKSKAKRPAPLAIPTETELLDICRSGEDQLYEFKGQGTDTKKIAREIAAMLNTRQGGVVFYGIGDDGTIQGSDLSRQKLDQALQNSVKNTISPAATIKLHSVRTLGHEIVAITVPPWNRKDVYHYDERVLLRKGTNVFAAKPEESKKLHRGEFVI
jgi:predicted component of type VI protein secretion system